jgi:hypothetical protein
MRIRCFPNDVPRRRKTRGAIAAKILADHSAPFPLEVATGKVIATHSKRRRRVEFLDFYERHHRGFSEPQASRHPRQP